LIGNNAPRRLKCATNYSMPHTPASFFLLNVVAGEKESGELHDHDLC